MTGVTRHPVRLVETAAVGEAMRAAALCMGALLGLSALSVPEAAAQAGSHSAETEGAATTADYDAIVVQALAAYEAGRWDEARRLFEWAHGLMPTARTLRTIGMSAFNQADYVAALQNLEAALADTRKPLTDEQRVHAAELIERANQQVGRFRLRVSPAGARLLVDRKSPVLIGEDQLVLTPGQHELSLRAEGYQPLDRRLQVKARDRAALDLKLLPVGATPAEPETSAAAAAATVQPDKTAAAKVHTEPDSTRATLGIASLVVGGAALIGSGVTAALALSEKSDLDIACRERRCPPEQHDGVDRYDTLRLASGLTLLGGAIFAGLGAVLLLTSEGEPERVQAVVGPGYAGLSGRL